MAVSLDEGNWITQLHEHLSDGTASMQSAMVALRRTTPGLDQMVHRCLAADLVQLQYGGSRSAHQASAVSAFLHDGGWSTALRGSRQRLAALWPTNPTAERGKRRRATMTHTVSREVARTLSRHLADGDQLITAKVEAAAAGNNTLHNHIQMAFLPDPDDAAPVVADVVSRLVAGLDDIISYAAQVSDSPRRLLWSPRAVRVGYGSTRLYDVVRATTPCAHVGRRFSNQTLFAAGPMVARWLMLRDRRNVEDRGGLPKVLPADVQTVVDAAAAVLSAGETVASGGTKLSAAVLQALQGSAGLQLVVEPNQPVGQQVLNVRA